MPQPVQTEIPPSNPVALASAAGVAARRAAAADRQAQTAEVDGYRVRPDAPPGTGWIIEPMANPGVPAWFLRDRAAAVAAIPRHRVRYA